MNSVNYGKYIGYIFHRISGFNFEGVIDPDNTML